MTEDITSLQIRILYDQVEGAEKRLTSLEQTGSKAAKSMQGFGSQISDNLKGLLKFATEAAIVVETVKLFKEICAKTAEFEKLQAGLISVTKSVEKGHIAFEALHEIADSTPASFAEVTDSFIKLVNFGLTPSERAFKAYGDMAAGSNKDLGQMVEAVAMATEGMFRPLKQFGITAKVIGDNVRFTFQGTRTVVKNSAAEIEKYLMGIGEKNFSGAMERQMNTLGGTMNRMKKEWDNLLNTVGENGLGTAASAGMEQAIKWMKLFEAEIKSGELEAEFKSWSIGWIDLAHTAKTNIWEMADEFKRATGQMDSDGQGWISKFIKSLKELPTNAKFIAQGAGIVFMMEKVKTAQAELDAIGSGYVPQVRTGRFFWNSRDMTAEEIENEKKNLQDFIAAQTEGNDEEAQNILNAKAKTESEVADFEKKAYEARLKREKDYTDKLSKFADTSNKKPGVLAGLVLPPSTENNSDPKKDPDAAKWETLKRQLEDQEMLVSDSYEKRLELIKKFTDEGSDYQVTMEVALTKKVEEEQQRRIDKIKEQPERYRSAMQQELALIEETYAKRKDIILSATELTEKEKEALLQKIDDEHKAQLFKHTQEEIKTQTAAYTDLFTNLQTIANGFGKKGFEEAKAMSEAIAVVKGIESVISSYAAGTRIGGPVVGAIFAGVSAAATGVQIAAIQKQKYTGAYAIGGLIPPGGVGMVGENGPELVQGPAMVTSAQATWDRGGSNFATPQNNVHVNIINASGEKVTENRRQDGDKQMIEFVIGQVRQGMAKDIAKGGTPLSKSIEGTYNLSRGRRS